MSTVADNAKPRRRLFSFSLRAFLLLVLVIAVPLAWVGWNIENIEVARQEEAAASALKKFGWNVYYRPWPGLPVFLNCRQVQIIATSGSSMLNDAGLVHLRWLPHVGLLEFTGTSVTDTGLVHLKGLPELEYVILSKTQVTDAGLVHLENLTQLKVLALDNTAVTDAGLIHLQRLPRLVELNLRRTQVTDAGVQELQRALPNCGIER